MCGRVCMFICSIKSLISASQLSIAIIINAHHRVRRGDKAAILNINRDFLELLLHQGYADLAEQDFTHQDIEKILDFKDEKEALKNIQEAITSKAVSRKQSKNIEENETLKLSIDKVVSHRISQDMIAFRASACVNVERLLLDALLLVIAEELEMIERIRECQVNLRPDLVQLITRTMDSSMKTPFKATTMTATDQGATSGSDSSSDSGSTGVSNSNSGSDSESRAMKVSAQAAADIEELKAIQQQGTSTINDEEEKEEEKKEDPDADLDSALVSAGNPQSSPAGTSTSTSEDGDGDSSPGGSGSKASDDHIGNAISDLLGSIFKGFRGDRGAGAGTGTGSGGKEDEPDKVTEPQGERQKASTAVRTGDLIDQTHPLCFLFTRFHFIVLSHSVTVSEYILLNLH